MKTKTLLILSLLATLVLAATLPSLAQAASDDAKLVRLIIDNRDSGNLKLRLINDDAAYNLKVSGNTRQTFTVMRGTYNYTLFGCNISHTGKVNIYNKTILINPVCGGNAKAAFQGSNKIDLSNYLKIVKVKLDNQTDQKVVVTMNGPAGYVFTVGVDQEPNYTIARGSYKVEYFACGSFVKKNFEAYKGAKLVLRCAK